MKTQYLRILKKCYTEMTSTEKYRSLDRRIIMKAGFIQFAPKLCNVDATIEELDKLLTDAPSADLLVLPELSNSGYNFPSKEIAFGCAEEISNSKYLKQLQNHCHRRNFYIVTGFCEKENGKLYNSSVLIGPDSIIGKYQKIHLFNNEKDIFEPGDAGLPVYDTSIGKIGMLVCFDWIFPEVWRILALKGADIVCHPSALVLPGLAQSAAPINALVNHFYVITANRIGTENDITFTGMTTLANPLGKILYQASADEIECKVFEIDLELSKNKKITPRNDIINDRRPDLYRELLTINHSEV